MRLAATLTMLLTAMLATMPPAQADGHPCEPECNGVRDVYEAVVFLAWEGCNVIGTVNDEVLYPTLSTIDEPIGLTERAVDEMQKAEREMWEQCYWDDESIQNEVFGILMGPGYTIIGIVDNLLMDCYVLPIGGEELIVGWSDYDNCGEPPMCAWTHDGGLPVGVLYDPCARYDDVCVKTPQGYLCNYEEAVEFLLGG